MDVGDADFQNAYNRDGSLQKKPDIDILLENTSPATARGIIAFIRETAAKV